MVNVVILELEKDKFFILKTNNSNYNLNNFNKDSYTFTIKYPPKSVFKIITDCDIFDLDKYIKKYMDKYGIDNVRGGSYLNEYLTPLENSSLKKELWIANNVYSDNLEKKDQNDNLNNKNKKKDDNHTINVVVHNILSKSSKIQKHPQSNLENVKEKKQENTGNNLLCCFGSRK